MDSSQVLIDVIIPAYNEEGSIAKVVQALPSDLIRHIIVCDNASTDATATKAKDAGAIVVSAPQKGYGSACLQGIAYAKSLDVAPDIIVFVDGDYSDYPEQLPEIVAPIIHQDMDMVIGSRAKGQMESGSMMPQQVFGNWLATNLIRIIYAYTFTDLGPFRAIKWDKLLEIDMQDEDFGWTVEMQVKAAKNKLKATEVPVKYRKRIGKSKVSGTLKGTLLAGHKILWTIFKLM